MNEDRLFEIVNRNNQNRASVSEEEIRKEREAKLEKMVTPELLTHFSRSDALKLIDYFSTVPATRTQDTASHYNLSNLSTESRDFLAREINGKKIIELGDAGRKINLPYFMQLGARSFETADSNYSGVDGLTYLMRQPESSAIVCSFGLFDEGVLYTAGAEKPLKDYVNKLCSEIYRVTPKGAITLHGLEFDEDLINIGFRDASAPKELDKYTPRTGGIRVLRK